MCLVNIKLEKIYIAFSLCLFFLPSQAIELNSGFDRSGNIKPFKEIKKKFGYRPGFLIKPLAEDRIYWGMSRDGRGVARYNLVSDDVDGWGLTRWPNEYKDKTISEINKHPFTHGKRGAELYDEYSSHAGTGSDANVGCLGEKPLRYGDIDNNGSKEIVLYLSEFDQKSDWVIFSPKKEKIIFSMRWQAKDFYKGDELAYYQYPSLENQSSSQNRGFQVFAKAFLGDFNKDKIPDILVWRKRYESLATGASKKGFELRGENFEHYSLIDGEYQPQVTIPLQIKDWLADSELTWSKGYPSKSECAGQEGQLIPEMHDPLLNDPDVLK